MASNRTDSKASAEAPADKPGPKRRRITKPYCRPARTPEVKADLLRAIGEIGLCDTSACDYAGIGYTTFKDWKASDPAFQAELTRARAGFKALHMQNIAHHARTDARHSEWLLARLYPGEFAERAIVDMNAAPGSPLDKLFEPAEVEGAEADLSPTDPDPDTE